MKVKELVERLKLCNQNAEVVLSVDEEGNRFNSLFDIAATNQVFIPEWNEVRFKELNSNLEKMGYTEEDVYSSDMPEGVEAVVLWP